MASINWPSTLAEALISQAPIREPGLAGWWSMNTVSEYPTGTATYFQDAWATVDSWASTGATIAVGGGMLTATALAIGAFRVQRAISSTNRTVRFRMRSTRAGSWRIYPNGVSGTFIAFTYSVANQWQVVDLLLLEDPTNPSIYCNATGSVGDTADIDWYYLGDGSYAANSLLDNSGNGNHYRIFGSTPIAGISGNGLSRDGTNDYERSELVKASIPDVWYLREVRPSGSTSLAQNQTMFNYGANTGAYLWVYREASTDTLRVAFFNTADTSVAFASFFTGFSATRIDIDVVVDWINRIVKVYRNGVFFGQATLTNAVKPSIGGYAYWGAYQGTAHFSRSTADERREYSMDVGAARIASLFAFPSSYQALPEYPLQSGYSNMGPEGVLRSSSDSGIDAVRRRWTAVPTYIDAQYQLTSFQRQLLEDFWKRQTKQGTIRFNWPHPEYGSVEARFRGRPSYSAVDTEVAANVSLEVFA